MIRMQSPQIFANPVLEEFRVNLLEMYLLYSPEIDSIC